MKHSFISVDMYLKMAYTMGNQMMKGSSTILGISYICTYTTIDFSKGSAQSAELYSAHMVAS